MYTFEAHYCKGRYLPGESEYNTSSSMTSCESQSVLGTYYIIILGNHQVGATNPKSHSALPVQVLAHRWYKFPVYPPS